MAQTVSASAPQAHEPALAGEDPLARLMKVTFDTDEMASFFDAFAPLDCTMTWASADPAK